MINKVTLIGHLGKDPEVKYLDKDRVVANLTLATNGRYNDRNGNRVETTEWHNLEMWDGLAKVAEKYLKKGDRVYVEGRLKTRKWQDDNNNDRYSTEIICTDFTFLTAKNEQTQQTGNSTPVNNTTAPTQTATSNNEGADDLPF